MTSARLSPGGDVSAQQLEDPGMTSVSAASADQRGAMAICDFMGQTVVITIITPILTGNEAADQLREVLAEAHREGTRRFVINLQNVAAMDSCCVSALIDLLMRMQQQEGRGRIALVNAAPNVAYIFRLTRLDRVFPICRDVMSALAAVEERPAA